MVFRIRNMQRVDATKIYYALLRENEEKSINSLLSYYSQQVSNDRKTLIADYDGEILAYLSLKRGSSSGPYKNDFIPYIDDFLVLPKYRNIGVGSKLLEKAEEEAVKYSDNISLSLPIVQKYFEVQNFFCKREYNHFGTGIWQNETQIQNGQNITFDENTKLYFIKNLKKDFIR